MGVAPWASSDIAVLLASEGLESSCSMHGDPDPDEGPRGEGQGTLLQVCVRHCCMQPACCSPQGQVCESGRQVEACQCDMEWKPDCCVAKLALACSALILVLHWPAQQSNVVLQDLREAFLQQFGGRGAVRTRRAAAFDFRLQQVAVRALQDDQ